MNITIKTIPHKEQRYETAGDWWFTRSGDIHIRVSKMSSWRFEVLVAIHELVEVVICKWTGVTQQTVDDFDIAFEKRRKKGNTDEPGDNFHAPYKYQHCIATGVERIVAAALGVSWTEYDKEVFNL